MNRDEHDGRTNEIQKVETGENGNNTTRKRAGQYL